MIAKSRLTVPLFCVFCASLWLNGGLRITVTDAQGRLLSGVRCSLLRSTEPTKIVATAVTSNEGVATFNEAPAGGYVLRVEGTGFETFTKDGVVIKGNEVSKMKVTLVVASVSAS